MSLEKVVVVGGGFAGLSATKALKKANVEITLLDRQNHHLFQPLLYQVATAGLSPGEIAMPIRHILRNQHNVRVVMTEVTSVDTSAQTVVTKDKAFPYDYLVLATGAHYNYFGHPEWEPIALSLKSVSDAVSIRRKILLAFEKAETCDNPERRDAYLAFCIIGAGPTGVEMAGALAELARKSLRGDFRKIRSASARILLLEAGPRILNGFPSDLSEKAMDSLRTLGVEVLVNSAVENISENSISVNGKTIGTKTVLWAAGVKGSRAANWLAAESDRSGRVRVDENLRVRPFSNIYVIGDTAYLEDETGKPLPGTAPVALQQGEYVGRHLMAQLEQRKLPEAFKFRDKGNLATIGRSSAIAHIGKLKFSGVIGWLLWLVVHIFFLIGFRNRIAVLFQWIWSYITFERSTRLITFSNSQEISDEPHGQ